LRKWSEALTCHPRNSRCWEINAILTVDQLVCLVEEIGFGLIQAHAIYAPYRDEIEDREWEFSRMLRATA